MRLAPIALSLVVSLGLVAPVSAQIQLETLAGQVYDGKVISDDGTSVEFETNQGMTMKLPHSNLTLTSRYMLRREKVGDDGASQLELAEWCVDEALYQEARRHYQLALAASPGDSKKINDSMTAARSTAGKELLQRAKTLQENNRRDDARQILSTIVQELPLEPVAKDAATMLADDNEQRKQSTFTRTANSSATATPEDGPKRQNGEDYSPEAHALFAPTVKLYHAILDKTQKGLVNSNRSRSIKDFESAIKDGDKARKAVDKVRPNGATDEEVAEALTLVDSKIEDATIDARIHLVDVYLLRDSYKQAADVAQAGMAEYPQSDRMRALMDRVTAASTNSGDGGWIIRRGGLGRPSHFGGGGRGR